MIDLDRKRFTWVYEEAQRLQTEMSDMIERRTKISLIIDNQRLRTENAKLREVLTEVEWEYLGYNNSPTCPWCAHEKIFGHADDCQRQKALVVDADDVGEIQAVIDDWLAGCPQPSI